MKFNLSKFALALGAVALIAVSGFILTREDTAEKQLRREAAATKEKTVRLEKSQPQEVAIPAMPSEPSKSELANSTQNSSVDLTEAEQKQLRTLNEILSSRNDNDPRMDTELRTLSTAAKQAMRQKYSTLQAERFNEKGTIVFLIGRSLTSVDDFEFMQQVLGEPQCMSLQDCNTVPISTGSHQEVSANVTLAYPQLMALKRTEAFLLSGNQDQALIQAALKSLDIAEQNSNPLVADAARKTREAYLQQTRSR